MRRIDRALSTSLALLFFVGCGSRYRSAFSHHFLDNQEVDLASIVQRLPAASRDDRPQNALGAPIAVASTHVEPGGEPRQLIAWRLEDGSELWRAEVAAATQPEILGDVVLTSTRERLVAFDLATGQELWRHELPDLAYVGAARDGASLYWAATVGALGGARRVGHVVAMDARSGAERWRHEVQGTFGQPAAAGGLLFVPWDRQNIAILDSGTGDELARLRSTDDVLAWAFDHPTGIYYGGRGIYRLTQRSHAGNRAQSTHLRPALGELPRQPESVWPDGFVPRPGTRSARGRIRVYFNPAPAPDDESIHIEGDTYYFVYFRYVFAYALDGALRWTRVLEQDVANAEVMPHGLLTFGEQGRARLIDRETGLDRWSWDGERQIASVALDAAGFDPSWAPGETRSLRETLNELILDPDNRLVPARTYAVSRLAQIAEPEITRDLLDLYQQRAMPGALKEAIRTALRGRRTGQQYLMEALARRYDYLQETEAPPLEAIVPALLAMNQASAVPQLIHHLMDHETPAEVLPELVSAIIALGGEEVVPALRRFLILYQEDSLFAGPVADQPPEEEDDSGVAADPEARALALASRGVFLHGGPEGRALLASLAAEDARLHRPVREHITLLYEEEREAASRAQAEEEAARRAALEAATAEAQAALPLRLSQAQVNAAFIENADALRDCIADELERNDRLAQVRLVFILTQDGRATDVAVAPRSDELAECVTPRVASIQFPRFRQRRMRSSFTISIRGGADPEDAEGAPPLLAAGAPEGAPWFWYEQERARLQGIAEQVPARVAAWWDEREPPRVTVASGAEAATFECPPGMPVEVCRQRRAGASRGGLDSVGRAGEVTAPPAVGDTRESGAGAPPPADPSAPRTSGHGLVRTGGSSRAGREPRSGPSDGAPAPDATPWWAAAASEETEDEDVEGSEEDDD